MQYFNVHKLKKSWYNIMLIVFMLCYVSNQLPKPCYFVDCESTINHELMWYSFKIATVVIIPELFSCFSLFEGRGKTLLLWVQHITIFANFCRL